MPTIRNGEDLCETTCLCGYNIKVSQSRFKLMMRLHYKKCAYKIAKGSSPPEAEAEAEAKEVPKSGCLIVD